MEWLIFVLLNVFFSSIVVISINLITKKYNISGARLMFHAAFFASLIYIPIFLYELSTNPTFNTTPIAIASLIGAGLLGAVGLLLFAKAYRTGHLSTIGPLENFRPIFAALFSILILGEVIKANVVTAIFLVVIGGFIVHMKKDLQKTINSILSSKESIFMMLSATIYGLVSVIDRIALQYYTPFKIYFFILVINTIYYFISLKAKKEKIDFSAEYIKTIALVSVSFVVAGTTILYALSLQTPTYVVPIQMSRTLVVSLFGSIFLKEKGIERKLIGALIMLAGVVILVL